MQIRKQFKFEAAHIVRKAYSKRCAKNIHGHSYILEVFLEGNQLDQAGMVMDFSEVKVFVNDFIDSFDHTLVLWNLPEEKAVIDFAIKNFERVVILPFNSTAEMQAKMFYEVLNRMLPKERTDKGVCISKCIVHETATGYAEYAGPIEYEDMPKASYPIGIFTTFGDQLHLSEDTIRISEGIEDEWKHTEMWADNYKSSFIM